MVRVDQVDTHLAGRNSGQVDCIDTTRVRPQPRQVVEVDVQMPDPWRYVEGACAEHWYDVHVLNPILNTDDALGECRGKREATISLGGGSFSMARYGVASRTVRRHQ
jgi:hypothetical protein